MIRNNIPFLLSQNELEVLVDEWKEDKCIGNIIINHVSNDLNKEELFVSEALVNSAELFFPERETFERPPKTQRCLFCG